MTDELIVIVGSAEFSDTSVITEPVTTESVSEVVPMSTGSPGYSQPRTIAS